MRGVEPALLPWSAAFLRPIFLIIKLEPMKTVEEMANISPTTLSCVFPMIYIFVVLHQACRAKMSDPKCLDLNQFDACIKIRKKSIKWPRDD